MTPGSSNPHALVVDVDAPTTGSTATAPTTSNPHALVVDVDAPALSDSDRHHLERVLRVRPGDGLTVGDGAGRWRECRMGAVLEPVGEVVFEPAPAPEVTVGFAVLKGGRSDHVVQKLTELGVDRIVPFVAERSVVRLDRSDPSRADKWLERWCRVAREAVMQSRRRWLPSIEPVRDFRDLDMAGVVLAVGGARAADPGEHRVLVGPEGGWTQEELAAVPDHVGLGPHVLRAETAAVAAATLLAARRSSLLPRRAAVSQEGG